MKKLFKIMFLFSLAFICLFVGCDCTKKDDNKNIFQEYYNAKIKIYEAENKNYTAGEVDVVFLGDSLTDGYDLKKYYPNYLTLNRGIGGDTTVGLENRLKVSVFDVQPKVAVMLIGANNMKEMLDNYESILIKFKYNLPNTQIVLLSLTSMSGEWGKNNQLAAYNNVQIKILAEKYGFNYIDLYSALLNIETGEIYNEYTTDGGHLTEKGYEVVTAKVTTVLQQILN